MIAVSLPFPISPVIGIWLVDDKSEGMAKEPLFKRLGCGMTHITSINISLAKLYSFNHIKLQGRLS